MMTPKGREPLAGAMTPRGDTHQGVRKSMASTTGQLMESESMLVDDAQESDVKLVFGENRTPINAATSASLIKLEERFNQMKKHRMSQINKETLDYLYVKFPNKDDWKKYYVRYQNSQLLFFSSVKVRNKIINLVETRL